MVPSHYLNQCWLIVNTDQWRLSKGNFTRDIPAINHENQVQFALIKCLSNLPAANEFSIMDALAPGITMMIARTSSAMIMAIKDWDVSCNLWERIVITCNSFNIKKLYQIQIPTYVSERNQQVQIQFCISGLLFCVVKETTMAVEFIAWQLITGRNHPSVIGFTA